MEIQPINFIADDIRKNLDNRENQTFIESIFSKSLKDLSEELKSNNSTEFEEFLAVNMLQKLCDNDEINLGSIDYFTELNSIVNQNEELKKECYFHLDSCLRKYINETINVIELFTLAQIAVRVYKFNNELNEAFICVENQTAFLYIKHLTDSSDFNDEENTLVRAKNLKKLAKLGYDIALTAMLFNREVVENIEERIQSHISGAIPIINFQNYYKIIAYMKCTKIDESEIYKLTEIENELLRFSEKEPKNYSKIMEFEKFSMIENKIDLSKLAKNVGPTKVENNRYYSLKVSSGHFNQNLVIIKEYELNLNLQENERKLSINRIYDEAKYLQYLEEKKMNSELITLKFHGLNTTDANKILLVHEGIFNNLDEHIEKLKNLNKKIEENELYHLTNDLLQIFNYLENLNIYHQNISLKSINNYGHQLKISDFSYAVVNENSSLDLNESLERQNYYWPEMVKGSIKKFGKQDTFALGIVLLIIALPDLREMLGKIPKTQEFLNESIKLIPYDWLKKLLRNMLTLECSERYRFKNLCIKPKEMDVTRSSISSRSSNSSRRG